MTQNIEEKIAQYFAKFAREGLRAGDAHMFITIVEYQSQVENKFWTADFERDLALRQMADKGWVTMPGGRVAYLTEAGFIERQRRHPSA